MIATFFDTLRIIAGSFPGQGNYSGYGGNIHVDFDAKGQ
jgi:hypothetical protein